MITNPDAAIIDLGWFGYSSNIDSWSKSLSNDLDFLGYSSIDKLTRKGAIGRIFQGESNTLWELYFLERLFEFDELWIDEKALNSNSFAIPEKLSSFIKVKKPSSNIYQKTSEELSKQIRAISEENKKSLCSLHHLPKNVDLNFDKIYDANGLTGLATRVVNSKPENDWIRAIFYLAFSDSLGVTPLLSGSKMRFLNTISDVCLKSLTSLKSQHDFVKTIFDSAYGEKIKNNNDPLWDVYVNNVPPIIEYVLYKSVEHNKNPIDLLLELRDSPEAVDYRRKLSELRWLSYGPERRRNLSKLGKVKKELNEVANAWSTELDSTAYINYIPRKITLKKLPLVGSILEMAGLEEYILKDRLLSSPPGYLVFCSSWYTSNFSFGKSDGYV